MERIIDLVLIQRMPMKGDFKSRTIYLTPMSQAIKVDVRYKEGGGSVIYCHNIRTLKKELEGLNLKYFSIFMGVA